MVARKWGWYVALPWSDSSSCHDSWAGFIVSRNSVGKFLASDLLQFVGYSGSLMIGWSGARELARNPGHALATPLAITSASCCGRCCRQYLSHSQLGMVVRSSRRRMESRKLCKAA